MRLRNLSNAINPILGILIVAIMALGFFSVTAYNQSLETEVEKAQAFCDIITDEIQSKSNIYQSKLDLVLEIPEMNAFIEQYESKGVVDSYLTQNVTDKLESMLLDEPEIEAFLVHNTYREPIYQFKITEDVAVIQEMPTSQWMDSGNGMFRSVVVHSEDERKLLLEIPVIENKEFQGYTLSFQIDLDQVMNLDYSKFGYNVDILSHSGLHMLSEGMTVVNELYNQYGYDLFDVKESFNRKKASFHISEMNYFKKHIIVSTVLNEHLSVVAVKAYNKYAISNMFSYVLSHIVVIGIMVLTMIGTILYSSQRTKIWIENDRQFLNEIIDMDKIQISELKKELKFNNDLFSEINAPLLIVDKDSLRIMNANTKAIKFYGYTENEMLDFYLTDICKWDDASDEVLDTVLVHHHKKSGDIEERRIHVNEIMFNETELLVLSITERSVLKQENLERLKMELLHEIRSPLQGAYGAVERIAAAKEGYSEYTNIIKRSLNSVLSMTNNILAEGKLSKQMNKIFVKEFDLVHLIDEVVTLTVYQDLHYNIIASNINEIIDDTLMPIYHYRMKSDPVKIRQILVNLMSNATKYTQDGMINLTVEILRKENKDILVFRVSDTGIGLTKEQIDHLYDEYETFSDIKDVTSTGLGLSITKKYVDLLNSELHVSSEFGVGTTFSFSLELEATRSVVGVHKNHSILIVDDDDISLEYLDRLITGELNCHVKALSNETEMLVELNRHSYDCLIIDQNLNHFKGVDLMNLIRSSFNKRIAEIPIILATAAHQVDDVELSDRTFMIHKPYDNETVLSMIKKLLTSKDDFKLHDLIDDTILDREKISDTITAVGTIVFSELVQKFKENSTEEIEAIKRLASEGNLDQTQGLLHRLKGAMSYFGPKESIDLIVELEQKAKDASEDFHERLDEFESAHKRLLYAVQVISDTLKKMP